MLEIYKIFGWDAKRPQRRGKDLNMFHRQRPQGVRLEIDLEAEVLISNSGADAYWLAHRRAEEASSELLARDWSTVAVVVARKMGKRPSLFATMFQGGRTTIGPLAARSAR